MCIPTFLLCTFLTGVLLCSIRRGCPTTTGDSTDSHFFQRLSRRLDKSNIHDLAPCGTIPITLENETNRTGDHRRLKHPKQIKSVLGVIDIRSASEPTTLSVNVCAGLFNRDETIAGAVYTFKSQEDVSWLEDTYGSSYSVTQPDPFLSTCLIAPMVDGYIRYDFASQQLIVPSLVTVAAMLNAVPLEQAQIQTFSPTVPVAFDAVNEWRGFSALQATKFVFNRWGQETSTMSKMNPGLEGETNDVIGQFNPVLTKKPELGHADLVVKEKMFNFFLWNGCIQGTDEEAWVSSMARPENNPWPNPIPVWGYDNTWLVFGGTVHEANTLCTDSKNMGSVPSCDANNLSYFSLTDPITSPLQVISSPGIRYDETKTYVSFIIGDGDNLNFVKSTRRAWMEERVKRCRHDCFPLLWSLSPHLLTVAPDIIRWYYSQAQKTGRDSFVLPPSGHLYSYPSQMPPNVRAEFIRLTENDARLMNANGVVAWEFAGSWWNAMQNYFPRYVPRNVVQAFFAVNVPYLVPIITAPFLDTYCVIRDKVVVFNSWVWRGTDERDPREYHLSVDSMANKINTFKKGSMISIYTSSDGGFELANLFEVVDKLGRHVQVVDDRQLTSLALQHSRRPWWENIWSFFGF